MEERVVERDRRHPAEPVEQRDLLLVEARRAAAREADHPQDAFGSAKRRADDRAELIGPSFCESPGVAAVVGHRQRLASRRHPTASPSPISTERPDLLGERTDTRHETSVSRSGLRR